MISDNLKMPYMRRAFEKAMTLEEVNLIRKEIEKRHDKLYLDGSITVKQLMRADRKLTDAAIYREFKIERELCGFK